MRGFIGYGELGKQIEQLVVSLNGPDESFYFDDELRAHNRQDCRPFNSYADDDYSHLEFYLCLGYKHLQTKAKILQQLLEAEVRMPPVSHPSSFVNDSARLGAGTVIYPMCNVDKNVEIGAGALLNNSVVVSHDARIGDCSYLSPGVVLSGFVRVGAKTFIGSGAIVSDTVKIGKNVRIGVGTIVTQDVPDGASVIGNPMRVLSSRLRLQRDDIERP